jgi:hypothetical protein
MLDPPGHIIHGEAGIGKTAITEAFLHGTNVAA